MIQKLAIFLLLLLALAGFFGYIAYNAIWGPNVTKNLDLYIPSEGSFDEMVESLESNAILKSSENFKRVSQLMKFGDKNLKPGFYKIKSGWTNRQLISALRSGNQTEIDLTYNNVRTIEDLAGVIGQQMEFDSLDFLNYIRNDSILNTYQKNEYDILSLFIPNTYKVFWNDSVEKTVKRLAREEDNFWKEKQRLEKLEQVGLTKEEVYNLASIVEKETLVNEEKPTIAGVYLNRIAKGILLQADPTVVYASGDFSIRRVLNKHLAIDNPYNTYLYAGIPPGPIYMPSTASLDAVLNPEKHRYLFFCAKPDNSGRHQFAKSLSEHNANAKKYQRWLSRSGIMK